MLRPDTWVPSDEGSLAQESLNREGGGEGKRGRAMDRIGAHNLTECRICVHNLKFENGLFYGLL